MPKVLEMNYCMQCGTKLTARLHPQEGMEVPYCPHCEAFRHPIYNTAVSMVVQNAAKDRILLIQQYGRPSFILVAGYINRGEDAEDAVRREVREETGLEVETVTFNRSHFFTSSNTLMLNFSCTVRDMEVHNNEEVDRWQWFTPEGALENIRPNSLAEQFLKHYLEKKENTE